jgi:hypothetical protein
MQCSANKLFKMSEISREKMSEIKLAQFQNKVLRNIVNATWYISKLVSDGVGN